MQKFIIFILLLFTCIFNSVKAQEVSFIYINGSNNNNEKMKNWFFEGINKLHPEMKKSFETDPFTYERFLKSGEDTIKKEPVPFFWGDMSKIEMERLNQELNFAKMFSPKISQLVREGLAYCLHDAIWVSKEHNMNPIVDKLHEEVMREYNKGNQVVLFGYSAGSFVSYEYMLEKSRYIDPDALIETLKMPDILRESLNKKDVKDTCPDAIEASRLAVLSVSGELIVNQSVSQVKEIYDNLDEYTEKVCVPNDAVRGVVNFASPFPLFYSEIGDMDSFITTGSKMLYIHMIKTGQFLLTVNWANDPLGFPSGKNSKLDEIEKALNVNIASPKGYVYDKSDKKSRSTFLMAHTSYWRNAKRFSKNVVEAYKKGYLNYYEPHSSNSL